MPNEENKHGVLFANGFDAAFLGLGQVFNKIVAVYDRDKCIKILMEREDWEEDDAEEYFEFNVLGSYVGEHTPCFVSLTTLDVAKERLR